MIETWCICGEVLEAPEDRVGRHEACPACRRGVSFVSAELLAEGQGAGDFDAALIVLSPPQAAGQQIFLGGCLDIEIGKLPDRQIVLPGKLVSRLHCKLARVDFGPSRWRVVDNHSTNGLRVNALPVKEQELVDGDVIGIGEFELQYRVMVAEEPSGAGAGAGAGASAGAGVAEASHVHAGLHAGAAATGTKARATGGLLCPSCERSLPPKAKICIDCGIHVPNGRPLLTAKGVDENELYVQGENALRILSWPIPFGFYPIASEAYGDKKPIASWVIVGVTVVASLMFLISGCGSGPRDLPTGSGLMLWPEAPRQAAGDAVAEEAVAETTSGEERSLEEIFGDEEMTWAERELALDEFFFGPRPRMDFQWYQYLTHALLHADIFHLAGNMLFLLVFATRVNALIGNVATAILYPLLAVAAAWAHLTLGDDPFGRPMLGASGAIMGMAGMYLVLFPLYRVFMAIWARWFLLFLPLIFWAGLKVSWNIFPARGLWVVLFYIAFDVLYVTLRLDTGVAHWAHLGGFGAGVVLALVLLMSRVINARGGDILSVVLGKHAWPLIGRPRGRTAPAASLPRGIPLN